MINHRLYRAFTFCLLLVLGACVSSSYFEATAIDTPGNAMLYIYRPAASNPGKKPLTLSYPEVMINGDSVGFLKYKEYLALEVEPGQKELRMTGLTREAKWKPRDVNYKLTVEAGESYFMRFGVEFDVDKMTLGSFRGQYIITFHPIAESDAVYEIRDTSNASKD